jgi:hypothetical protein
MKKGFVATSKDHPLNQLKPPAPPKSKIKKIVKPRAKKRPVKKGK